MKLFDILDFTIVDAIDIVLFAALLYYLYRLIRGTVAINIFMGIVIIYLIWKITEALQMQLLSSILGQFIGVGVFALIVVFQQEIRRFLLTIGSTNITARNKLHRAFHFFKEKEILLNIESLPLDFVTQTGDKVNIEFSEPIIESIFYKNSPLHDGAIVIKGDHIVATRVILPVASEINLPKRYGLRHRAAISITEKTDATALVVSEETGHISYFKNGAFVKFKNNDELIKAVQSDF